MVCIYCGNETSVFNSRAKARTPSVWRRRRCDTCVAQFTTIELPDYATALVIRTHTDKLLPFSRDKLFLSLLRALGHRQDALKSATALTETVIGSLLRKKQASEGLILSKDVAQACYQSLKR